MIFDGVGACRLREETDQFDVAAVGKKDQGVGCDVVGVSTSGVEGERLGERGGDCGGGMGGRYGEEED